MEPRLLIVEDSKEDLAAILRALDCSAATAQITYSSTGDDALETLGALVADGKISRLPQIILLDLNLPGTDGREVLSELKSDRLLNVIPVVVLTTSTNPRDVAYCYRKGANGYCVKGGDRATFVETIQAFKRFWLQTAILPNRVDER